VSEDDSSFSFPFSDLEEDDVDLDLVLPKRMSGDALI